METHTHPTFASFHSFICPTCAGIQPNCRKPFHKVNYLTKTSCQSLFLMVVSQAVARFSDIRESGCVRYCAAWQTHGSTFVSGIYCYFAGENPPLICGSKSPTPRWIASYQFRS